ncbi:MAG: Holliday junction branch migration protein RuvA [Rhodothalassiaceae bacterium]
MIGRLKGVVDEIGEDWLILDVGGVGYRAFASARTLRAVKRGDPTVLEIETHVREDHIHLYAFRDGAEKTQFGLLTSVKGVGARVALAILSVLEPNDLAQAIMMGDKTAVARAQGVGPKLAQRIVMELAEAVGALPATTPATATAAAVPDMKSDAVSALTNLGYRPAEAQAALTRVIDRDGTALALNDLIRRGLKELAG